jgi:hypothetical protein
MKYKVRHNKKFVLGAVSLVQGRVRNSIEVGNEVLNEINGLIPDDFFRGAPFNRIDLEMRYGTKTQHEPEYLDIEDGWLGISIELEMAKLQNLDRSELKRIFKSAALDALIAVAKKYNLPDQQFRNAKEALIAD